MFPLVIAGFVVGVVVGVLAHSHGKPESGCVSRIEWSQKQGQ